MVYAEKNPHPNSYIQNFRAIKDGRVPHLAPNIRISSQSSMLSGYWGQIPRFFRIARQYQGYTEK